MTKPISVRVTVLVDRILERQMPLCFRRLSQHTGPVRDRIGLQLRQQEYEAVFRNTNGKEWWDSGNPV